MNEAQKMKSLLENVERNLKRSRGGDLYMDHKSEGFWMLF